MVIKHNSDGKSSLKKKITMKNIALVFMFLLFLTGCQNDPAAKFIPGYIEGNFVMISATSSGILQSLAVKRGDTVIKGDALFSLDLTGIVTQKRQAQKQINIVQEEMNHAIKMYRRIVKLHEIDAASDAEIEDAQTQLQILADKFEIAKHQLFQIEKQLARARPTAPQGGIVQDTFYATGEFVERGRPIVSILPRKNIKIRFFVSQKEVPLLSLGQSITVSCDGCTKLIGAHISYIAQHAEYTPPVIYSRPSRSKMVFLIEARPEKYTSLLRPGLPVSILLGKHHGE